MTSLHWRIMTLLAWLTFFFNIERISFGTQASIQLNVGIYIIGTVAALLPLAPFAQQRSLFSLVIVITLLDVAALLLDGTPIFGIYTYVTFSSFVFLIVTLVLSYRVSQATLEFRKAIETITFSGENGQLRDLRDLRDIVDTEMVRSRRFERPLSLVMLQADPSSLNMTMHRLVQEVQRSMMQRYVLATMASVLARCRRRTDIIIEDQKPGRLLFLAPETNEHEAVKMGERITQLVQERLGISAHYSIAAFPQHALTFEDLLSVAEQRIKSEPTTGDDDDGDDLSGGILDFSPRSKEWVSARD